jgi:hypothetical protein
VDLPRSSSCAAYRGSCRRQSASVWQPSCAGRHDAARARTVSAAWLWLYSLAGSYDAGRRSVLRYAQKSPGRRCNFGQHPRRSRRPSCMREATRRPAGQRAMIVAGARQHCEGNSPRDLLPTAPARQLLENIGAHQPDEARARKPTQQAAQRLDRVARAEHRLDRAGHDASSIRNRARGCQTLMERRHPALRLQRIARRNQQPDLIEPQSSSREFDDMAMAFMRRIERTAEQADAHSAAVAETRDRLMPRRRVQGRTCPVPMTR